ncbi:DUF6703 family protein [Rudaeicoccus suwonensis]|nr:DUF6703 family protein [Rudaeicoccus suwonensis]
MSSSQPSVSVSPLRARVEHASDPAVQALARVPRAVPAVVDLLLIVVGAIFRGATGAICFGAIAVVLAWLLYLAWPRAGSTERMMRSAVLLLAVALTVVCAAG